MVGILPINAFIYPIFYRIYRYNIGIFHLKGGKYETVLFKRRVFIKHTYYYS